MYCWADTRFSTNFCVRQTGVNSLCLLNSCLLYDNCYTIFENLKNMPNLTLYHFIACPYCQRVRDYLTQAGISVPMKDTHETPAFREELIKIGGKSQVPCLVIDGKALYESLNIIEWLKKNFKK